MGSAPPRPLGVLLLLMAVAAMAVPLLPSDNMTQWTYVACQADAICAEAFPSGADLVVFSDMLDFYVISRADGGIGVVELVESCVGVVPPVNSTACDDVEQMWIWMLREAEVCPPNEEWLIDTGVCSCIEGRNCNSDCLSQQSAGIVALCIVIGVFCVLVLVVFLWESAQQKQLAASITKSTQDMRQLALAADAKAFIVAPPTGPPGSQPTAVVAGAAKIALGIAGSHVKGPSSF